MLRPHPRWKPRLAPSRGTRGTTAPPVMATFLRVTGLVSTKPIHFHPARQTGRAVYRAPSAASARARRARARTTACRSVRCRRPLIDDVRSVRRDREVARLWVDDERRPGLRQCQAGDARRARTSREPDRRASQRHRHDRRSDRDDEAAPQRPPRRRLDVRAGSASSASSESDVARRRTCRPAARRRSLVRQRFISIRTERGVRRWQRAPVRLTPEHRPPACRTRRRP